MWTSSFGGLLNVSYLHTNTSEKRGEVARILDESITKETTTKKQNKNKNTPRSQHRWGKDSNIRKTNTTINQKDSIIKKKVGSDKLMDENSLTEW